MNIRLFLFIFLLCCGCRAVAQRQGCNLVFTGHVFVSDTSRLYAAGATVRFPSTGKSLVADSSGNFVADNLCPGKIRIVVSYEGYKTVDTVFAIRGDFTWNVVLAGGVEQLNSFTVTGQFVDKEQISTAIRTVLSGASLDATRGLSLGESLKAIPGVNSLQSGPSISKPVIHGVYSNRVLIMNNGVRQEGQTWGNDHAPEIDPFIATKITVIKGAASVRYGSDAIGGVVLLDPKDLPEKPGLAGEVNLVGMSNGREGTASAMIESAEGGKWDGLSWRLLGTVKKAGNFRAAHYYLDNTGFDENDYSATLQYKRPHYGGALYFSQFNTRIGIADASVVGSQSDFESAIALGRPIDDGKFRYAFGRPDQTVNHQLFKASGFFDLPGNGGKLEAVYAFQHDVRKEYDANPVENSDTSLNTNGIPDLNFQLNTSTVDLIWKHPPVAGKFTGSLGLNFITHANIQQGTSYQELIPNFLDYGGGLFAIEKYATRKWLFEAGLRYDYRWMQAYKYDPTTVTEEKPVYRWQQPTANAGATYSFSEHLSADYNFGTAWRSPQVIELFANGIHQSAADWEVGDSSLTLERAYNNNLSFAWKTDKISLDAGVYVNYFHHYIYAKPDLTFVTTLQGTFPSFSYTQVNALFQGIDVSLTYRFAKNLSLISKTSLVRARNLNTHDWLIGIPADRFNNSIRYEWPVLRRLKHVFAEVSNLAVAKQSRVPPHSDFAPPPPGYVLWGASAGCSVPFYGKEIDLSLEATNMTNVDYKDYLNRFRYFMGDLGRNILLRIKVPF